MVADFAILDFPVGMTGFEIILQQLHIHPTIFPDFERLTALLTSF
jgi:hypothetical protein